MGKKRREKSRLKRKESSTATQLQEHRSGDGEARQVKKDNGMPKQLIESSQVQLSLVESKGNTVIVRGEFGRIGVPTLNGRIYPEAIMQREIDRLQEDLSNRRVLGTVDHPESGKTSLWDVSHAMTSLKIKDGIVIGEAVVLNNRAGKLIKSFMEAGIPVPVSSRGFGSTKPSNDPKMEGEVVQDDFILKTWDFVADPAVITAVPGFFTEDVDTEEDRLDIANMFLEEFPQIAATLQEDAIAKAKLKVGKGVDEAIKESNDKLREVMIESFEKQLAKSLIEAREDLSNELTEEFNADPEMGGAKAMLSAIFEMVASFRASEDEQAIIDASKAKDLEVAEARDSADKSAEMAIKHECAAYIEKEISGHYMAESIRKLVSKHQFVSLEDAKEKLAAILRDLPARTEEQISPEDMKIREENAAMRERVSLLTERVESLDVKMRKAVKVGMEADNQRKDAESRVSEVETELKVALDESKEAEERHSFELYKHKRVVGLPNGRELIGLMEGASTKAVVDKLVTEQGTGRISREQITDARKKLMRGNSGLEERENKLLNEEHRNADKEDDLGNDMDFMARMAGVSE